MFFITIFLLICVCLFVCCSITGFGDEMEESGFTQEVILVQEEEERGGEGGGGGRKKGGVTVKKVFSTFIFKSVPLVR